MEHTAFWVLLALVLRFTPTVSFCEEGGQIINLDEINKSFHGPSSGIRPCVGPIQRRERRVVQVRLFTRLNRRPADREGWKQVLRPRPNRAFFLPKHGGEYVQKDRQVPGEFQRSERD